MEEIYASGLTGRYETELRQAGLDIHLIRQLKNKGFNQSEIAELYGVTRQAVSWIWRQYGGELSTRQRVKKAMPFTSEGKFSRAYPLQMLRDHAEFVLEGRIDQWKAKRVERLRGFYKRLREENLVVEYDPDFPPNPGVSKPGGFDYRQREPRDGNLLIRVNEYTNPTEYEGKNVWQFPPQDP